MARSSFRGSLEADIDQDGLLQIKCAPMFEKELKRVLKDIADLSRVFVKQRHSNKYPRTGLKSEPNPRKTGGTGRLFSSIKPYRGRSADIHRTSPHHISGRVTAGSSRAPYARFVHEGTRAHEINARPGGYLAFVMTNRTGIKRRRVLTPDIDLYDTGSGDSQRAIKRRERRNAAGGGPKRLRSRDADTEIVSVSVNLKDRIVVTRKVHHPGYKGDRFLNEAAAIVVHRRYGGRVDLPRRS